MVIGRYVWQRVYRATRKTKKRHRHESFFYVLESHRPMVRRRRAGFDFRERQVLVGGNQDDLVPEKVSPFAKNIGLPVLVQEWGRRAGQASLRITNAENARGLASKTQADHQDFATQWLWTYNHDRPNMALGGITPKQKLALAA
jgi:hypothetical protein